MRKPTKTDENVYFVFPPLFDVAVTVLLVVFDPKR